MQHVKPFKERRKQRLEILWLGRVASLLSILFGWLFFSTWLGPTVLPGPTTTLEYIGLEWKRGQLWLHVGATLQRVMLAFLLAMLLGLMLGAWMGRSRLAEAMLGAWVALGLALPRILIIVTAYLVIGLNEQAAVLAVFLIILPNVVVQIQEGVRSLDGRLIQMAQAFRLPPRRLWWRVILPQLAPFFWGTARSTLSLAWKMVVFVELLGRSNGVGYQIAFYFNTFEMRGILAYGLVMVLLLIVLDGLLYLAAGWSGRWRGRP